MHFFCTILLPYVLMYMALGEENRDKYKVGHHMWVTLFMLQDKTKSGSLTRTEGIEKTAFFVTTGPYLTLDPRADQ